jgi:NAD(P)-dependent dehydrogenase (short-subunit alcohol dehydrogenase family)
MSSKGTLIITGVSSGIGLAIAEAALEAGYRVQGVGRNEPTGLSDKGAWTFTKADMTRGEDVDAVEFAVSESGPTVLINNAGTLGPVAKSERAQWAEIEHCMNLNVVGPMRLSARFLEGVEGEKQVLFTGSGAGQFAIPGWSAYCASKSAIHMYAEVLAQEYPDVPIHAFKPGKVDTPMQAEIRNTTADDFPAVDHFIDEYNQGNLVRPETVAQRLLHLIEHPQEHPVVVALSQVNT